MQIGCLIPLLMCIRQAITTALVLRPAPRLARMVRGTPTNKGELCCSSTRHSKTLYIPAEPGIFTGSPIAVVFRRIAMRLISWRSCGVYNPPCRFMVGGELCFCWLLAVFVPTPAQLEPFHLDEPYSSRLGILT